MKSIWDIPFIVVDVETSGSSPTDNRIIEIACVTVIGGEIVSKYTSLVNPHQFIPPFISKMTGISNEMAFAAPEIEEVFPEINRIFNRNDCVFVAHNARFDWSFVASFFSASGAQVPKLPKLCTLKLSRRLLPKKLKKNVGSLAEFFNVQIKDRHRALGDALATAYILLELMQKAESEHNINKLDELLIFQNRQIKNFRSESENMQILKEKIRTIPEEPGVYKFFDKRSNLLYIGKAKSLRDRVKTYFYDETVTSKKISEMIRRIHDIQWDVTGTELSALLLESKLIKSEKPPYNTANKVYKKYPFIKLTNEDFPRLEMAFAADDDGAEYFGPFQSPTLVEELILTLEKQFKVRKCEKTFAPAENSKPCFYYHIKRCDAPCALLTSSDEYSAELKKIRYFLGGFNDGIIRQLEGKMESFAEQLNFEKANQLKIQIIELKKLFERKYSVSTSINSTNMMLIHPASANFTGAEIFFIRMGKLVHNRICCSDDNMEDLFEKVVEIFFNGFDESSAVTLEDAFEMRIIASWSYRNKSSSYFVYTDDKDKFDVFAELSNIIETINTKPLIEELYPEEDE